MVKTGQAHWLQAEMTATWEFMAGYQYGATLLAANITRIDVPGVYHGQGDDFTSNRQLAEIAVTRFLRSDGTGFHAGLAFAYVYDDNIEPTNATEGPAV